MKIIRNTDFKKIDFMEEWHGVTNNHNEWEKNEEFWRDKTNKGNVITTLYGGDFHKKEHFQESDVFNWIYIDGSKEIESQIINAISLERIIMSKGPCFHMRLIKADKVYNIGSMVELKENEKFKIIIDTDSVASYNNMIFNLIDNFGKRIEFEDNIIEIYGKKNLRWMRLELLNKTSREILAKGNPIYFQQVDD